MATSIILRSAQRLVKSSLLKSVNVKQNCKTRHSSQGKLSSDIKIAVVGAGPAGFYASQHLLNHSDNNLTVDIFERLPVPFGLVRYGVAPDHPEVKNVENTFTNIAENPRVKFFGNVAIGSDIKIDELLKAYHAVILAYGAAKDRTLDIPGENLRNVISARSFVGYYNGLPEASYLKDKISLDTHDTAVIIGLGNVALDVARVLLTPLDILKKTDITEESLEMLSKSTIKNVYIVGRRGPLHVSFTIKELREMVNLQGATPNFDKQDFHGIQTIIPKLTRPRKRLTELLARTALEKPTEKQEKLWAQGTKRWYLKLLRTPIEIIPTSNLDQSVAGIKLGVNELYPREDMNESQTIVDTGNTEIIDCGLVLRSIGYKSIPVEPGIPFDNKRGIIPNENGKIANVPGLFCAGWLATGPRGVIVNTMTEAFKVGQTVLENISQLKEQDKLGYEQIKHIFHDRNVKPVRFEDWKQIDLIERKHGETRGKPREKITNISKMISAIDEEKNNK